MHESAQRQELDSLLPPLEPNSRRGFLTTTLPMGFALAVQPVMAQTMITTPSDGLTAGEVKIKTLDGEMVAYRAMPAKGKNFPCVLVVEEIFGVHEHIKDICRRFAKLGYLAIAPELFARYGDPSKISDMQVLIRDIMAQLWRGDRLHGRADRHQFRRFPRKSREIGRILARQRAIGLPYRGSARRHAAHRQRVRR